jgi:hypothetical protein
VVSKPNPSPLSIVPSSKANLASFSISSPLN